MQSIDAMIAPYGPTVPLDQLVERVNRFYHAVEASHYDQRHPEIHRSLPPIWRAMIRQALTLSTAHQWAILDYGCGTGFEAEQIVRNVAASRIASLTCYDPSPEMLAECQRKIAPLCRNAVFTTDVGELRHSPQPFDILMTNSLLHHLRSPWSTIGSLLPRCAGNAVWLQGHEPSRRFYTNQECLRVLQARERESQWTKFISPTNYLAKLKTAIHCQWDPAATAARESHRSGLFRRRPPVRLMGLLVDFHVPHSAEEARAGQGFDYQQMAQELAASWQLVWVATYSYMGSRYEGREPRRWRRASDILKAKYPSDGANFSCVWSRRLRPSERAGTGSEP